MTYFKIGLKDGTTVMFHCFSTTTSRLEGVSPREESLYRELMDVNGFIAETRIPGYCRGVGSAFGFKQMVRVADIVSIEGIRLESTPQEPEPTRPDIDIGDVNI